jgi:hypothetical protein
VTLRLWEIGAAVLGALFAFIFIFSNVWGIGVGMLCADALWLLTRLEIVEKPGAPGRYAALRGRLGVVKLVLVLGVYAAVIYGVLIVQSDDGQNTRVGVVALFALIGLGYLLLGELQRSGDEALNWLIGARAERIVGRELDALKAGGWLVLHGHKREWGGDIDHVLSGPRGVYAIETKSYGFRRRDLRQPAWNAAWLKERVGISWVTGVLCVNEDRPPTLEGKVWVMGYRELRPWLETRRNPTIAPDRFLAALGHLPSTQGTVVEGSKSRSVA